MIKKIAVITDNGFINDELFEKNKNLKQIKLSYILPDGREFKNENDIPDEEFYKILENGFIKTSQASIGVMDQAWTEYLKEYDFLIVTGITRWLSGSYSTQVQLAKEEKFKDKVLVIDTESMSVILEKIIKIILNYINNNEIENAKSLETKLYEKINIIKKSYKCLIIPKSLETLKNGGRVSNVVYTMSNVLKLKPILLFHGKVTKYGILKNYVKGIYKQLAHLKNAFKTDYIQYAISKFDDENFEKELVKNASDIGFKEIIKVKIPRIILAHWGKNMLVLNVWKNKKSSQ